VTGPQITVVVMTYNEADTLPSAVNELHDALNALGETYEIVIVDDGSTDDTARCCTDLVRTFPSVRVVRHAVNRGLGGVYRTGFCEARGEFVTFFPADGQFSADILGDFVAAIPHADMVLGYLTHRRGSVLGRILSSAERLLYYVWLGPMPRFQGILMFRRRLLDTIELSSDGRGWAVLMEFILKAARRGYRLANLPISLRPRHHGRSKVNNLRTIWANFSMLLRLRQHLTGRDRPKSDDLWGFARQRSLLNNVFLRYGLLILGLWSLVFWQNGIRNRGATISKQYAQRAASGMHQERRFAYFLYYLHVFPIATEIGRLDYSQQGAERLVREHGDTLVMEVGHTIRGGDLLRTYLYLPSAWFSGVENASVRPFHAAVFVLALLSLFLALWWVRQPVLAVVLPLLVGSHPTQLYEVYRHENVFGWPMTIAILILALHIPLFFSRRAARSYLWLCVGVTALILGTIKEVRTEAAIAGSGAMLAYLAAGHIAWRRRLLACGLLALSVLAVNAAWRQYFTNRWQEARTLVSRAGGHVYNGPRSAHHALWHPIWCGLGDFGGDRGYVWLDQAAHAYATPILETHFGLELPRLRDPGDQVYRDAFWDAGRKYYKVTSEMPHYEDALRGKVLGDIRAAPFWYLGILAKRTWRVLTETAPVALQVGDRTYELPGGWTALLLPLLIVLLAHRRVELITLLLVTLPLSAPAILIYSGKGMTYFALFPQIMVALVVAFIVEWFLRWLKLQESDNSVQP
jgi:glycosyltransferase involved in cell wall biosynthesis